MKKNKNEVIITISIYWPPILLEFHTFIQSVEVQLQKVLVNRFKVHRHFLHCDYVNDLSLHITI